MLFRPDRNDYKVVGFYISRVLAAVGMLMLLPAILGFVVGEEEPALGFLIGALLALLIAVAGSHWCATTKSIDRTHAMVVAGASWLLAPVLGAVPLRLSGHYSRYLDAYFDAMSGFATAGLSVINDLDHVADSVNLWRHLMQYVGGQGLVLVVLTVFAAGAGGAMTMYTAEAREEKIVPNIISTARFIARVSLLWLVIATPILTIGMLAAGQRSWDSVFHAMNLFMAAFSTGGFAPMTASVAFYHSALIEGLLAVVMIAGATSFGLHHQIYRRRLGAVARHLEARTFLVCLIGFFALAAAGLSTSGAYDSPEALFRRGFFYLLSAQTTTGFATLPSRTMVAEWGTVAPAMVVGAMMIGAMSGSTGGGIKTVRLGIAAKTVRLDIRKLLTPASATVVEQYHALQLRTITPAVTGPALMVLLLFLTLYAAGALVGMFYGYPFDQAFFESVSAGATVGLSVGLTGPTLPTGLKIVYILQMWMGRLELIAVFALFGFAYAAFRGRV